MNFVKLIFRNTLNSVIFGITIMALTAAYIAIGSGMPSIRAYFEMSDLQFFNAWPLKLLMTLLVMNLTVVTFKRIPFTPPRYGVWCVHAGIIVLIIGTASYYAKKVEGLARIPVGQTADHYYDSAERALYAKVGKQIGEPWPLPSLPRFATYDDEHNNANKLRGKDLTDLGAGMKLQQALGLDKPVDAKVVAFYPYADIVTDYTDAPDGNEVGIQCMLSDPHGDAGGNLAFWLINSDPRTQRTMMGADFEHRHLPHSFDPSLLKEAIANIHKLDVKVKDFSETLNVEVGKDYPLGNTGYTLSITQFDPAFPTMAGKIVPLMTMMVKTPTQEFRRQVIPDGPTTDWKLNVAGAGPFGKRQTEPLDKDLKIAYEFHDTFHLLPQDSTEKHTFVTSVKPGIIEVVTRLDGPSEVKVYEQNEVDLTIAEHELRGPFQPPPDPNAPKHEHPMKIVRKDHVKRTDRVRETPMVKRDRDASAVGMFQIAKVRLTVGDWTRDVLVPYTQWTMEDPWGGATVSIPGAKSELHLQLGNTALVMPAKVTLQKFDLVPYPGGRAAAGNMMRDFRSTLIFEDVSTGEKTTGVAKMNSPVYYAGGDWTFFQAQWDPNGQKWTVLGVGNRPFVGTMTLGCAMIILGLLYAFYVKPIIIRRMKQNAIEKAKQAASTRKKAKQELVAS
ncbi:MAG TPA: hypothetical protein VL282_08590 [Tepidisphaeraceae bacterium]|nr:hypothetical protein [Tepidisphaeraceae bacterium]